MTREQLEALARRPRPERLRRLRAAMSEAARERCWERLDADGRADVIAAEFKARQTRLKP